MNSAINNLLQQYLCTFMDTVAERFDIDREELDELWKETQKKKLTKTKRTRSTKKKTIPSAYVLFCTDERPKINEEMPHLTFPEKGRELGKRWREATDKVKNHYKNQHEILKQEKADEKSNTTDVDEEVNPPPVVNTDDESSVMGAGEEDVLPDEKPKKKKPKKTKTVDIPDDITNERERDLWEEFASLTIAQLRTQCDHNNLKKSKNRNDMIHALVVHRIALEDGDDTHMDSSDEDED